VRDYKNLELNIERVVFIKGVYIEERKKAIQNTS